MLGLSPTIRACLFDLDGVLTRTATAHARAWKDMFDGFLRERAKRRGEQFTPLAAGRAGGFGLVIGIDRVGQAGALRSSGADLVVGDLAELLEHQ